MLEGKTLLITGRQFAMQEKYEPNVVAPYYIHANVSIKVVKIIPIYDEIIKKLIWGKE